VSACIVLAVAPRRRKRRASGPATADGPTA